MRDLSIDELAIVSGGCVNCTGNAGNPNCHCGGSSADATANTKCLEDGDTVICTNMTVRFNRLQQ